MAIVTRRHLAEAAARYQDTASEIAAWVAIVSQVRWRNFNEVRGVFGDADAVDGYVIFNVRHSHYRLITMLHYAKDPGDRKTENYSPCQHPRRGRKERL